MDVLITDMLMNLLLISITFSIIQMALIQKIKSLDVLTKGWQVWILNLILSFILGIPFGIFFYNLEIIEAIWIAVFGFIGAPSIYHALKNQNIINYKPKSISNSITLSKNNEIKRGDLT